ncbi:MAG: ActS/PrrB/RegB family redox-sensitive histidine kinase [Pseudomonadota bacterium]
MKVDEYSELKTRQSGSNLRLETLVRIRWLAVFGQASAVLVVTLYLGFEFNALICFLLIGTSVILNVILNLLYPANHRLSPTASTALLSYDVVQLAMLLYFTGGIQNPFCVLILVPVVISATTLSTRSTLFLGCLGVVCASILVFYHAPFPTLPGQPLMLPQIYKTGMWVAIVSTLSFMAIYAFRVADEARKLSDALSATELILQREQYLTSMDGLAAAAAHELGTPLSTIALVSKEMTRELEDNSPLYDDAKLLRSQAERCREILMKLTSLSTQDDQHFSRIPFSAILEDISAPHREFGIKIIIDSPKDTYEPQCVRNPGILYGLGNLVENAVDHAKEKILLNASWDEERIVVRISDDGSGFDDEVLARIGEPFVARRARKKRSGGLGLGLFIAKTLLERSGATLSFSNYSSNGLSGANAIVEWPRYLIEIDKKQLT